MASTVLDIYNAAISAAHGKGRLSSLTDNTVEREECDIWYPIVRDTVQEAAHWDTCRETERLTLIKERDASLSWAAGDPESQYIYSYALPNNYLRAWNLTNFQHFTISFDATNNKNILNTNFKSAVLIYGGLRDNPAFWSAGMIAATIHGLASFIVGPLTGQDRVQQLQLQLANNILFSAQAVNANNAGFIPETIPPALIARGYSEGQETRFYYPYGQTFAAATANA